MIDIADLQAERENLQRRLDAFDALISTYGETAVITKRAPRGRPKTIETDYTTGVETGVKKRKRRMSPVAKAKLAAIARRRWAKVRAAGGNAL